MLFLFFEPVSNYASKMLSEASCALFVFTTWTVSPIDQKSTASKFVRRPTIRVHASSFDCRAEAVFTSSAIPRLGSPMRLFVKWLLSINVFGLDGVPVLIGHDRSKSISSSAPCVSQFVSNPNLNMLLNTRSLIVSLRSTNNNRQQSVFSK